MTLSRSTRQLGLSIDPGNRDKNDFCRTPISATQALLSVEKFTGAIEEPACGDGAINKVLIGVGYSLISTDSVDYCYGRSRVDFLMGWRAPDENICTNPHTTSLATRPNASGTPSIWPVARSRCCFVRLASTAKGAGRSTGDSLLASGYSYAATAMTARPADARYLLVCGGTGPPRRTRAWLARRRA